MRMKPEHAERLLQLFELTHLSPRSQLILARRIARHAWYEYLLCRAGLEALLKNAATREVANLKRTQSQAAQKHRKTLHDIGTWLSHNEILLTEMCGVDGICDVLEVNPAHRAQVVRSTIDQERVLSAVVFGYALEDSASALAGRHPAEWKEGPLYQALRETAKQAHTG